jgi:hypothetical protein
VHRVVATQCALAREFAGASRKRFVDADDHQFGIERVELGHRTNMATSGQALCPPRRSKCRARFRVGKDTGGRLVATPQLRSDIGAVLDHDELDQRRGFEVQPQRRCSATSSDTEPRAATLARRRERGRSGKRTSPRRTSSSNASSRPIADRRATRLPRRVTTISTPCSTRSRCSLKRSCRARTPTSSSPRCSVIHRSLAATLRTAVAGNARPARVHNEGTGTGDPALRPHYAPGRRVLTR